MRPHSGLHYSKICLKGQLSANDFAAKIILLHGPNRILAKQISIRATSQNSTRCPLHSTLLLNLHPDFLHNSIPFKDVGAGFPVKPAPLYRHALPITGVNNNFCCFTNY